MEPGLLNVHNRIQMTLFSLYVLAVPRLDANTGLDLTLSPVGFGRLAQIEVQEM